MKKWIFPILTISSLMLITACGGGSGGGTKSQAPSQSSQGSAYTVSGTIVGLTSDGLVLSNGEDSLNVASGATSFRFDHAVTNPVFYVASYPSGGNCYVDWSQETISNGSISGIVLDCRDPFYYMHTVRGSITGLVTDGLVLKNNNENLKIPANASSFVFKIPVEDGHSYSMSVTSPSGYSCAFVPASSSSGTVNGADIVLNLLCTQIPTADAGASYSVLRNQNVTLDGTKSSAGVSYQWTMESNPQGSTATLSSPSVANPTFTPDLVGTYRLGLVVYRPAQPAPVPSLKSYVTIIASAIALPRSGQTTCYNQSNAVVPCDGTGQDGDLKKGVAWPASRFVDNNNGTITDTLTGLIWGKNDCGAGPWGPTLIATNEMKDGVCGLSDKSTARQWRLPNVAELESLANYGEAQSLDWLLGQGFTFPAVSDLWSSTSNDAACIWTMGFGAIGTTCSFPNANHSLVVRDGAPESVIHLPQTGVKTCALEGVPVNITSGNPANISYFFPEWKLLFSNDDQVVFHTEGHLPTGIAADTTYYVIQSNTAGFQISHSPGGAPLTTSGSQVGKVIVNRRESSASGLTSWIEADCSDPDVIAGQDGALQKGVPWDQATRFNDNNDGTVSDHLTGLIWASDPSTPTLGSVCGGGKMLWFDALSYIKCLNDNRYLGASDWRLPNIVELKSIVYPNYRHEAATNAAWLNLQHGFKNVQNAKYWSATPSTSTYSLKAFYVEMSTGTASTQIATFWATIDNHFYVWPVRGGLK